MMLRYRLLVLGVLLAGALLGGLSALPHVSAAWDDPAFGGTGDYAWISFPDDAVPIGGTILLKGTAGNNYTAPRCGSESASLSPDPAGDGGVQSGITVTVNGNTIPLGAPVAGSDIGNVWVCNDDGMKFKILLRLHENPPESTPSGGVSWNVQFTDSSRSVRYWVEGIQDAALGWQFRLLVQNGGGTWCNLTPTYPITGSFAPAAVGGILSFGVDYDDLSVSAMPADCATLVFAGPVVPSDVLNQWQARSGVFGRGGVSTTVYADSSTSVTGSWTLGSTPAPIGPFSPVTVSVDGVFVGTTSTMVPATLAIDEYEFSLDLTPFPVTDCKNKVRVMYGTASDTKNYIQPGCMPPTPVITMPKEPDHPGDDRASVSGAPKPAATGHDHDLDGEDDDRDLCPFQRSAASDMDGDGLADDCDSDRDGDGYLNRRDNCPNVFNPDQRDTDRDGVGDACAKDLDRDGFADDLDNCPSVANPSQADLDGDGIGNACDPDMDGDGVPNEKDRFPSNPTEWGDLDGDGIGDNRDTDRDGDGYVNSVEEAAGSDPWDASSIPRPADVRVQGGSEQASVGSMGGWGLLLGLVMLGLVLFLVLRPRDESPRDASD
jgi:hypothetical protein